MSQYFPVNARSVPFSRSTWYCSGLSDARHSASVRTTLSTIFFSPWMTTVTFAGTGAAPRFSAGAASAAPAEAPPQPVTASSAASTQTEAQAARSRAGRAMRGIVGNAAGGASYRE